MEHDQADSSGACCAALEDPCVERTTWHSLEAIVAIALGAVIGGADGWVEIAECGQAKETWFATILDVPHGAPAHDTFLWAGVRGLGSGSVRGVFPGVGRGRGGTTRA